MQTSPRDARVFPSAASWLVEIARASSGERRGSNFLRSHRETHVKFLFNMGFHHVADVMSFKYRLEIRVIQSITIFRLVFSID